MSDAGWREQASRCRVPCVAGVRFAFSFSTPSLLEFEQSLRQAVNYPVLGKPLVRFLTWCPSLERKRLSPVLLPACSGESRRGEERLPPPARREEERREREEALERRKEERASKGSASAGAARRETFDWLGRIFFALEQ